MKKYKLIKEYPGSPKLNSIWEYEGNVWSDCNHFTSPIINPENYPEFWEKVVEKDYEILSFIATKWCKGDRYLTIRKPDEDYTVYDFLYKGACVQSGDYQIHSIKRLSDGEIFTIGDEIGVSGFSFPIVSFKIHDEENTILVSYRDKNGSGLYNTRLKNIQKVKKPLFTTEDGVDIFEGDKYYKIVNKTFQLLVMENASKGESLKSKIFSTKEKAEEYILLIKPWLSFQDVLDVSQFNCFNFEELKDLVKSKINLENA